MTTSVAPSSLSCTNPPSSVHQDSASLRHPHPPETWASTCTAMILRLNVDRPGVFSPEPRVFSVRRLGRRQEKGRIMILDDLREIQRRGPRRPAVLVAVSGRHEGSSRAYRLSAPCGERGTR